MNPARSPFRGEKGLEKLTQLEELTLQDNQLTELPKGLEKLAKLENLYLSDNKLTDVKGLEKLTELRHLYLHEYLEQNHQAQVMAQSGANPKPNQRNLATDPKHAGKRKEMEALLLSEMKRLGDPHRLWDQPRD